MKNFIENIKNNLAIITLFLITTIFLVMCCSVEAMGVFVDKNYPLLEDSIAEVDELIGEYSGYYVAIDTDKNTIGHKIAGAEISENNIVIIIPYGLSKQDIIVDFYTSWNDLLGSYKCNFIENESYTVHGKTISVFESDMQSVFIDLDTDLFNEVNGSNRDDKPKKKAPMQISTSTESASLNTAAGTIKPRGNSSWNLYGKLPYSIKTEKAKDLFGLGTAKKWNLLANASDKTLLKDVVFFELGNQLGIENTPRIKHVNLFINNWYYGVYCITTKIDGGQYNMNLSYNDFIVNWGSPHYENSIDFDCDFWLDNPVYSDVNGEIDDRSFVEVQWPDNNEISYIQRDKIHRIIQDYVDVLEFRKEGKLSDYIDITSFAKYYWVEEISMNGDAWSRSFFTYYKNSTGKLYAGPLWDMEWALGCVMEKNGIDLATPEGWKIRQTGMFEKLFQHKEFTDEVNRLYYDLHIDSIMRENYDFYKYESKQLEDIGEVNYIMYIDENNYFDFQYGDSVNNYRTFTDEKLKFYNDRINWIINEMENEHIKKL